MSRAGHVLKAFLQDVRGLSALEFALVFPAILAVFAGASEVSSAMMNERRVSHAVSSIGDLSSQQQVLTVTKVKDIFAAATIIMQPYSTAPLNLRLTSVTEKVGGTFNVDWSQAQGTGLPAYTKNGVYSGAALPAGVLTTPGDTVIIAEGTYAYTSPLAVTIPTGLLFSNTFYFHPRFPGSLVCKTC